MTHTIFAGFFIIAFAISLGLFGAGVATKSRDLLRWGTWGFVLSFVFLVILYSSGFPLKAQILSHSPDLVIKAAEKHHRMAKFVLTGCMLITAACTTILIKFNKTEAPAWFAPNILFISLTLLIFVLRSLLTGFGIGWAEQKQKSQPAPSPASSVLKPGG
ncbi:hypothetical protein COW36_15400 [bacterium (Candidatus Blackallbacteria) CG17_big_fil_post_rev_8_21_14_2_50_48_46]|uniref:Uncharacterized protein n=1 Tax=bacterium (Candidatus Blackallbacteria) CG17_big_fil_post_rev_8_21_14_2_50_48_46 TaxID=2014261 RepID=A0A2M7G247_9BACT|nr:MAG: hypothetical protein COW64_16370 [bacterium (Candidatus Blackallbacteria) CG18_big_fil_WC_8_21_14_2_50_49_26]PIW15855.1 MAG: hypothetical protein COW36_15400 [bacterium (Candidatus Blackallbacteria) CG17_big_fil_post_rev_8_21_14_2_50_48_46]PIW49424.1 MAG: hypothetical protein COW20_05890 [bacterium (Candidatus Blackallbacteria) CG13_big_fil_rev_8_21_14_2_50_49_14]